MLFSDVGYGGGSSNDDNGCCWSVAGKGRMQRGGDGDEQVNSQKKKYVLCELGQRRSPSPTG